MTLDQARIREIRNRLATRGPVWTRGPDQDFATVTLPARDCDRLRDRLLAEGAGTVVEIGLAYGSSALAIGEALAAGPAPRHLIVDPFQDSAYHDVGWDVLGEAGLHETTELIRRPSSMALPALLAQGLQADAAFVDGSHRFHEVFVDLYFLRKIVRPGGLIVLDDYAVPSVRTALHYFVRNLGWVIENHQDQDRCRSVRLPEARTEPPFEDFVRFSDSDMRD